MNRPTSSAKTTRLPRASVATSWPYAQPEPTAKQWHSVTTAVSYPKRYYLPTYNNKSALGAFIVIDYSNFIAFVGSIFAISIDGNTSIRTDNRNMPRFIGISNHVNSIGTLSM